MDCDDISGQMNYVAELGAAPTPEEKTVLQTSLTILKARNKFARVAFWGRIQGERKDYLIAQGIGEDALASKQSFYSVDGGQNWAIIPPLKDELLDQYPNLVGIFTGDPATKLYIKPKPEPVEGEEEPQEEEGDEEGKDDPSKYLTEEDRLAFTIIGIDTDASVVPRGAYVHNSNHQVVKNKLFDGIPSKDWEKLSSYFHLRDPVHFRAKPLLDRELLDKTIDFLDPLSADDPKGCWGINYNPSTCCVTLKSLVWPGFIFYYHTPSKRFGHVYFGTGEKNVDIAFML